MELKKPPRLREGDRIATISLSWGGAGDLPVRYLAGKWQLARAFGLEVVETKHALKTADWIYENPKARAEDLMEAFADPSIKGIVSNIGGEDSIRILPHVDLDVIANNPKVFVGFSDTTVTHMACLKAGIVSFYGPSVLAGFAENGGMFPYCETGFRQAVFQEAPIGKLKPNQGGWTNEMLDWAEPENQLQKRKLNPAIPWRFLQGKGKVSGHLIVGCMEVMESLKGTSYWPTDEQWEGAILALETSEERMPPDNFRWQLRNYAAIGVLGRINGLLLGRPYDNVHASAYDENILKVLKEEGLTELPVVTGMDFGHSEPMLTLPIGVQAEIDSEKMTVSVVEAGVS